VNEGFKEMNLPPYSADNPKIYHSGDVMYDNSMHFASAAEQKTKVISVNNLQKGKFILATIYRNNNTDEPARLNTLFKSLNDISNENDLDVILPLHPRTSKLLETNLDPSLLKAVRSNSKFKIIPPASFLEMIALEKNCAMVMTDSGGVQKEAFYFEKPCIILRPETEWVELVECGSAIVTDADENRIKHAFAKLYNVTNLSYPKFYGDGKAAQFICGELLQYLK
jgi:UDP-GlcNAc3NAcA epimerase